MTSTIWPFFFFFLNDPPPTELSPLPLHDALPISSRHPLPASRWSPHHAPPAHRRRRRHRPHRFRDLPRRLAPEPAHMRAGGDRGVADLGTDVAGRSEEHTSELRHSQISYAVLCL